jgi:aspartate aminotransferase-like enzyme
MIDHRGPIFSELITGITAHLKQVFMTQSDVFVLTSSGTGSLEAALVNTLSPGDRVLAPSAGAFGNRFIDIAVAFGAEVQRLDVEWGCPIDPQIIREALQRDPAIKAVMITHNETSTGVTHDLESIARVVKGEFHKLILVDAVSSLGCIPLPVDGWSCDMVGTASQKGFMIPPGLAFISVSQDAWEAQKTARMPRFYFDLMESRKYLELGQTPWTPNLAAIYGLSRSLEDMVAEGMENIFERHARIAQFTRDAVQELGLELLCQDPHRASNTVTAVKIPAGVDGRQMVRLMRDEEDVVLAGGQGKLAGNIFRIGHLGYVTQDDIQEVLEALQRVLPRVGFKAG